MLRLHQRIFPRYYGVIEPASISRHITTNTKSTEKHLELLHNFKHTYPEGSQYLNPQHFYQVSIRKWLKRSPRPLTLAQIVKYGKQMSKQKIIASANHVVEELTIRFAHRIRQMQLLPYRLMGHPALLNTYEQYIDSFEMLRRIGEIHTLEDNNELMDIGKKLLQKHTKVVTNVICGVQEILSQPHKPEDVELLNELAKSLLTSRLSRRVLVKQHAILTKAWLEQNQEKSEKNASNLGILKASEVTEQGTHREGDTAGLNPEDSDFIGNGSPSPSILYQSSMDGPVLQEPLPQRVRSERVGEVVLNCRIVDALSTVELRAKTNLSQVYKKSIEEMPQIVIEGSDMDIAATFPYIWPHFEFAVGELLFNSLDACLRQKVVDPIVVTVSATPDSVLVRISDRGGGLTVDQQRDIWSVANPSSAKQAPITPRDLANHQFFSLLFPAEELPQDFPRKSDVPNSTTHLGLGLALSKLYVEYWGGALELHSLDGFGCDALLRVSRTGSQRENLRLNNEEFHH